MKRLQNILAFFALLAFLLLGGALPNLAAAWQDSAGEKPGFAPIGEISLEVGDKNSENVHGKLALLGGAQQSMEIPPSLAATSEANLETRVRNIISSYQKEGLLPGLSQPLTSAQFRNQPYLVRWSDSDTEGTIFWNVNVNLDPTYSRSLYLILDDESGRVCLMEYYDGSYTESAVNYATTYQLENLCKLYLQGLGSEFEQYDPASLVKNAYYAGEGGSLTTTLNWGDILYGEVTLQFEVSPAFFRVGFASDSYNAANSGDIT